MHEYRTEVDIMQDDLSYMKLSKRALNCMYTADIIMGVILLAIIGSVDYFWVLSLIHI